MYKTRHDIRNFANNKGPFVLIEVDNVHGSAPRDQKTWMLVDDERIFRTIGGGQLEKTALEHARSMLRENRENKSEKQLQQERKIQLGAHIGQCCGGVVVLKFTCLDHTGLDKCIHNLDAEMKTLANIYIFGAGHVGNALAQTLLLLPLNPILVDTREKELDAAPRDICKCLTSMPEMNVRQAPPDSAFVILTHDHSLDFLIAREALARHDAAYVGMIGSKTKRATFRHWLRRENGTEGRFEKLTCPIGSKSVDDKRPEVIAALTAAEIIVHLNSKQARIADNINHLKTQGIGKQGIGKPGIGKNVQDFA